MKKVLIITSLLVSSGLIGMQKKPYRPLYERQISTCEELNERAGIFHRWTQMDLVRASQSNYQAEKRLNEEITKFAAKNPKDAANWLINELNSFAEMPVPPRKVVETRSYPPYEKYFRVNIDFGMHEVGRRVWRVIAESITVGLTQAGSYEESIKEINNLVEQIGHQY